MSSYARHVLRKNARLERPDAMSFGFLDQALKQDPANTTFAGLFSNVDADLSDTGINPPTRHRAQRRPPQPGSVL